MSRARRPERACLFVVRRLEIVFVLGRKPPVRKKAIRVAENRSRSVRKRWVLQRVGDAVSELSALPVSLNFSRSHCLGQTLQADFELNQQKFYSLETAALVAFGAGDSEQISGMLFDLTGGDMLPSELGVEPGYLLLWQAALIPRQTTIEVPAHIGKRLGWAIRPPASRRRTRAPGRSAHCRSLARIARQNPSTS